MANLGIKSFERRKLIWARIVAKKLNIGGKNHVALRLVRFGVSGAVESSPASAISPVGLLMPQTLPTVSLVKAHLHKVE